MNNGPRIEIQAPTSGFIIGRSLVGDALAAESEALEWINFLPDTSQITIDREAGDTGTLSVTLFDRNRAKLLEEDPNILPNRPVRVVSNVADKVLKDENWTLENSQVPYAGTGRFGYTFTNFGDTPDFEWIASEGVLRHHSAYAWGYHTIDLSIFIREEDGETSTGVMEFIPSVDLTGGLWWRDPDGTNVPRPDGWVTTGFASPFKAGQFYRVEFTGPTTTVQAQLWLSPASGAPAAPFHLDLTELRYTATGPGEEPMFTGVVHDFSVLWDKEDNASVVFTGVDATASLANTTRHGLTGAPGYRTWPEQIAKLATSAKVPIEIPEAPRSVRVLSIEPDDWSRFGTTPSGLTAQPLTNTGLGLTFANTKKSSTVSSTAYAYGVQTTVEGLEVGADYEITALVNTPGHLLMGYAIGVQGKGWGQPVMLPFGNKNTVLTYNFTATADTHVIRLAPSETKTFGSGGIYMTYVNTVDLTINKSSDEYRLQDLAYEGPLSEHLTIASQSVGAQWGVERDGVVRFTRNRAHTAAWFTDYIPTNPPPEYFEENPDYAFVDQTSYTDIVVAYDTTKVINVLNVENKGRDPLTGDTLDETYAFIDESSAALWGPRSADLTFSLYDQGAWAGSVERRATEYLHSHRAMDRTPVSLTFNAKDNPTFAKTVDIHDHILVTRHGQTTFCHIYGVHHNITPETHAVTLDLGKHGH